MKSVTKGIKAIDDAISRNTPQEYDGPKVNWLKLKDGERVKARFINELDEESPNYDESRGLAVVIAEHVNPKDFHKKAACTMDSEGRCFGCEMYRAETPASREEVEGKSWRAKLRFYVNLLINDGTQEPYVAVWSQGTGQKQTQFPTIREYFEDTNSISNLWWNMKRVGSDKSTTYTLLPTVPDTEPFDWKGVEPINLEHVVREVPYAEQEAFYLGFESAPASTTNIDW
jgi:hypothetical protein